MPFSPLGFLQHEELAPFPDPWDTFRVNRDEYAQNVEAIRKKNKIWSAWVDMQRKYRPQLRTNPKWWKITHVIDNLDPTFLDLAQLEMKEVLLTLTPADDIDKSFRKIDERYNYLREHRENLTQQQREEIYFLKDMHDKYYRYEGTELFAKLAPIYNLASRAINQDDYRGVQFLLTKLEHDDDDESSITDDVTWEMYLLNARDIITNKKKLSPWLKMSRLFRNSLKDAKGENIEEWWKITHVFANELQNEDLLKLAKKKMDDLKFALMPTPKVLRDAMYLMEAEKNRLKAIPPLRLVQEQRDRLDFLDTVDETFYDYIGVGEGPIDWTARPDVAAILVMARFAKTKSEREQIKLKLSQLDRPDWFDLEDYEDDE